VWLLSGALQEVALVSTVERRDDVMADRRKMGVHSPSRALKSKLPGALKAALEEKATDLVERVLKPRFIKPAPEKELFT
jgi:hypothetical protein